MVLEASIYPDGVRGLHLEATNTIVERKGEKKEVQIVRYLLLRKSSLSH